MTFMTPMGESIYQFTEANKVADNAYANLNEAKRVCKNYQELFDKSCQQLEGRLCKTKPSSDFTEKIKRQLAGSEARVEECQELYNQASTALQNFFV